MSLRYFSITGRDELTKEPALFSLVKRYKLIVNVFRAQIDAKSIWIAVSLEGEDEKIEEAILDLTCRGAIIAEGGSEMIQTGEPARVITLRVRLTFPADKVREPLFSTVINDNNVVVNVRRASISSEQGVVDWEISGPVEAVEAAIEQVKKFGVGVGPVEGNILE